MLHTALDRKHSCVRSFNGLKPDDRLQDLEAELLERKDQVQALERELHQTNVNLAEKVPSCLPLSASGTPGQTLLICELAGLPLAAPGVT